MRNEKVQLLCCGESNTSEREFDGAALSIGVCRLCGRRIRGNGGSGESHYGGGCSSGSLVSFIVQRFGGGVVICGRGVPIR